MGWFGGKEFVVLLSDATLEMAQGVAEPLRSQREHLKIIEGLRVTVSIGITVVPVNEKLETVLKQADRALYWAKSKGRNPIELS